MALALAKERAKIGKDQEVSLVILPEAKGLLETILERQEDDAWSPGCPPTCAGCSCWARTASSADIFARLPFELTIR